MAIREAILNAIVHKNYASAIPVQISVYEDKIYIWNPGQLPNNWTVESLFRKHSSQPFNPLIATAFYRTGMIEAWGRGIEKIKDECESIGNPLPEYRIDGEGIMMLFKVSKVGDKVGDKLTDNQRKIIQPEICV